MRRVNEWNEVKDREKMKVNEEEWIREGDVPFRCIQWRERKKEGNKKLME